MTTLATKNNLPNNQEMSFHSPEVDQFYSVLAKLGISVDSFVDLHDDGTISYGFKTYQGFPLGDTVVYYPSQSIVLHARNINEKRFLMNRAVISYAVKNRVLEELCATDFRDGCYIDQCADSNILFGKLHNSYSESNYALAQQACRFDPWGFEVKGQGRPLFFHTDYSWIGPSAVSGFQGLHKEALQTNIGKGLDPETEHNLAALVAVNEAALRKTAYDKFRQSI